MAEYIANAVQSVALNTPILFNASIPCNSGCVFHEDESGIFILKGKTNNCFARYQVTFNGNIAIPEGGTPGSISVAIAIDGEAIPTSNAISTPTAVDQYNNVTSPAIIDVPRGCCFNVAIENTSTVPINMQNANLVINRIA